MGRKRFISLQPSPDSWLSFLYFWQSFKNCHRNEPLSFMRDVREARGGESRRRFGERYWEAECLSSASQPAVQSDRWGYVWLLIPPEPLYLQSLVRERNTAIEGKLARVHGCPSCNKGLSFHIEISNFIFREKEKQ